MSKDKGEDGAGAGAGIGVAVGGGRAGVIAIKAMKTANNIFAMEFAEYMYAAFGHDFTALNHALLMAPLKGVCNYEESDSYLTAFIKVSSSVRENIKYLFHPQDFRMVRELVGPEDTENSYEVVKIKKFSGPDDSKGVEANDADFLNVYLNNLDLIKSTLLGIVQDDSSVQPFDKASLSSAIENAVVILSEAKEKSPSISKIPTGGYELSFGSSVISRPVDIMPSDGPPLLADGGGVTPSCRRGSCRRGYFSS